MANGARVAGVEWGGVGGPCLFHQVLVGWLENFVVYLLRNFIFTGLAIIGTKFCLCSKVTDQW